MAEEASKTEEESMKQIFDANMQLIDVIENGKESTGSDTVQTLIKAAIRKFEILTNMVSLAGLYSNNESVEELPTESLQYLLLPALLGTLTLKLSSQPRKDVIFIAEIYFRDFIQRCKDYGLTNVELPESQEQDRPRPQQTEADRITEMVRTREAKIKRYKREKELKDKLDKMRKEMTPNVDEEVKRDFQLTLIQTYINQAVDELCSIEQEKPILAYMELHSGADRRLPEKPAAPLQPVVITRDALQKAVYGAGYPALPSLTIEEFYDRRVREGLFPGSCTSIPHTTVQSSDAEQSEDADRRKEQLEEGDDPEELERQRNMDDFKDTTRRGDGNRYNRS